MSDVHARVVILGAGHAGGSAAALLRQYGAQGPITLLGEEPILPYHRPPLSKAWLQGEASAESLALKPASFYAEQNIHFRPNTRVTSIDRGARTVLLADGSSLDYDYLILATGARPIALPIAGAAPQGVLFLRTAADAEALKNQIGPGKRLAVVGGGYIGLEVAASARALGAEVVVLEREPRLLSRVASAPLSKFFRDTHVQHGVRFEFNANVAEFQGKDGRICGVKLDDGRNIECDAAVVGVGARPNDELAAEAGLETARGVVVDRHARTSDPHIFAIGDVSLRPTTFYNRMVRMESVPNALEQARQAACAITGRPAPAEEVPWQWSDQYNIKLQIAGYAFDVDEIVMRGEPGSGKLAVFHLKGDQVQSVEAINAPPEFMMGRQLIGNRKAVDRARLANPAISIKEVVA